MFKVNSRILLVGLVVATSASGCGYQKLETPFPPTFGAPTQPASTVPPDGIYPVGEEPRSTPIPQSYPAASTEQDTPPTPLGPTAYPTREWIVAEGEVSILDKTWFITLPKGWTASSLPTTVDIRNYSEDLGGELGVFTIGDPHIVIRLTLSEVPENFSALDVMHGLRVADYSEEELAAISAIEPFDVAGYSGYVSQNSNGMGAQRAFVFDKNRVGLIIDILPLTSPAFDDASKVLATLRQE